MKKFFIMVYSGLHGGAVFIGPLPKDTAEHIAENERYNDQGLWYDLMDEEEAIRYGMCEKRTTSKILTTLNSVSDVLANVFKSE